VVREATRHARDVDETLFGAEGDAVRPLLRRIAEHRTPAG
jgi:hypothetical protein